MVRYAHERMNAFKKGMKLVELIYKLNEELPDDERFGLKSQMKRASVSYISNFVEGNSRTSFKEKRRFFECGSGSLLELDCQVMLSKQLFNIGDDKVNYIRNQIEELVKITSGLKRSTY